MPSSDSCIDFPKDKLHADLMEKVRSHQFSGVVLVQQGDRTLFKSAYGYGSQFLLTPQNEVIRWGHTREEDGVSGRFYYYPPHNVDVVILANQIWCAGELAWDIHSLLA